MSGFAGIIRIEPGPAGEADRAAIERMGRAIAFRGPDSLQHTHQPGASFVFSFLKTGPYPQDASQPCTIARVSNAIRISVGTPDEHAFLDDALSRVSS